MLMTCLQHLPTMTFDFPFFKAKSLVAVILMCVTGGGQRSPLGVAPQDTIHLDFVFVLPTGLQSLA